MKKNNIRKIKESDLQEIVSKIISEVERPIEMGKSGMYGARSRADFHPTGREEEMGKLFGKYSEDMPPVVLRYLRKIPRKTLTSRLLDLGLLDIETLVDELDDLGLL